MSAHSVNVSGQPGEPPVGIELEPADADGQRLLVRYPARARIVLAIGRSFLLGLFGALLVELWLHVHLFFLFLGLPLLLAGPAAAELALGRYALLIAPAGGFFSGPREIRRSELASLKIGRGGLWQAFRLELVAALRTGEEVTLLANLEREQAHYLLGSVERWRASAS
ncbi:MAG TPA: hypothetical protein VGI10_17675 [Polyangiaceae bacterium]